jgi:hypothetical protein
LRITRDACLDRLARRHEADEQAEHMPSADVLPVLGAIALQRLIRVEVQHMVDPMARILGQALRQAVRWRPPRARRGHIIPGS